MDALRNSDQSAAEGRLGFSKATSLTGELAGLKLALEEGVRGSVYALLKQRKGQDSQQLLAPSITCELMRQGQDLPQATPGQSDAFTLFITCNTLAAPQLRSY